MTHRTCTALLTLAAALGGPLAVSQDQGVARSVPSEQVLAEQALAGMEWLAGTWSGDIWGGRFVAYYSSPEGGKILSHSKLIKDGEEAFYEFEVFEARDLTVHLAPFPGGRRADGFLMKSLDPEERMVVFENPDKDFPTRITYQRVSEDRLEIVLSDPHGGSDQLDRFELSRDAQAR